MEDSLLSLRKALAPLYGLNDLVDRSRAPKLLDRFKRGQEEVLIRRHLRSGHDHEPARPPIRE